MATRLTRWPLRPVALAAALGALAGCGGGSVDDDVATASTVSAASASVDEARERAQALAAAPNPWINPNHLVVQIWPGEDIQTVANLIGGKVIDRLDARPIYLLSAKDPASAPAKIMQSGRAVFAELNHVVFSPEHASEAIRNSVSAIGKLDDPKAGLYPRWAESELRLPEIQARGAGVTVAVLDTGIDLQHADFYRRLSTKRRDFIAPDDTPTDEFPAIPPPFDVEDGVDWAYGHGTHVAGVIARAAPLAKIMPVRVLDAQGHGTLWVVAKGIVYAIDPDRNFATDDGAAVLNLSFGTIDSGDSLRSVIEIAGCGPSLMSRTSGFEDIGFEADRERCARQYEAVVVAGAGNDPGAHLYPSAYAGPLGARLRGLLSVTATAEHRKLPLFASLDPTVMVGAPGDRITSSFPGGFQATMTGTSMAAPWVSATAALILSTVPPGGDGTRPTPRQWRSDNVVGRIISPALTTPLCAPTPIRQVDPVAAVSGFSSTPRSCP